MSQFFPPSFPDRILPSLVQGRSHHVVVHAPSRLVAAHDRSHLVVVRDLLANDRRHLVDALHVVVLHHREEEDEVILTLRQDLGLVRLFVGDLRHDDHIHDVHRTDPEDTLHRDDHPRDDVQDHPVLHEGMQIPCKLVLVMTRFSTHQRQGADFHAICH